MSARMRHTVIVRHPETFAPTALVVGTEVPDWAKDMIQAGDLEPAAKADTEAKDNGNGNGSGSGESTEAKKAPAKKTAARKPAAKADTEA